MPAPGAPREPLVIKTNLQTRSFLGLSFRLGLLNIITLTLWRFWGRTEVRERIWRAVRINDDALEYTGRGVELFVGFLLALILLGLPFLLIVFGAQLLNPVVTLAIIIPLYLVMFWLWGFGVFSAFRYMASRTTWRGIRFQLAGSPVRYGNHFLLCLFLTIITLGWFRPEADRKLSEMTWDNLFLGTRRIRFRMADSHKIGVYGFYALGWVGQIVGYIVFSILVGAILFAVAAATEPSGGAYEPSSKAGYFTAPLPSAPTAPAEDLPPEGAEADAPPNAVGVEAPDPAVDPEPGPQISDMAFLLASYGAMAIAYPIWLLMWAPYNAAILRSIVAGIRFDEARFKLHIRALGLWWLTVSNLFCLVVSLGFLMPWLQARSVKYIVDRIKVAGDVHLDDIEQAKRGPRTGEGLADAFGFSLL